MLNHLFYKRKGKILICYEKYFIRKIKMLYGQNIIFLIIKFKW